MVPSGCARRDDGPDPADPFVRAYADCTRTRTRLGEAGEVLEIGTTSYDDYGDPREDTFERLETGIVTVTTWEYRAPHEPTVELAEDVHGGQRTESTWRFGRVIRQERDNGTDGVLDWVVTRQYDGNLPTVWEHDSDADGAPDARATWTWGRADGVRTAVYTEGPAEGPPFATGTATADGAGNILGFELSTEDGPHSTYEAGPYNALRETARVAHTTFDGGEVDWLYTLETPLDDLGRPTSRRVYSEFVVETGEPVVTDVTHGFEYDCP